MSSDRLLCVIRASPLWYTRGSLNEASKKSDAWDLGLDIAWYARKYRREMAGFSLAECVNHYLRTSVSSPVNPNLLFDELWYRHSYGELLANSGENCCGWRHYLREGARQRLNPVFWFDESWYLRSHPEVRDAIQRGALLCGFEHFLLYGIHQDLAPSLYFDPSWYRRQYLGCGQPNGYPLVDFLMSNANTFRCPVPFFDGEWYRAQYLTESDGRVETALTAQTVFEHYLLYGRKRGFSPSPRFNEKVYRESHPEVELDIAAGKYASGFEHFVAKGVLQGFSPATHFRAAGSDYSAPRLVREFERSVRLNLKQFSSLRDLVERLRNGGSDR